MAPQTAMFSVVNNNVKKLSLEKDNKAPPSPDLDPSVPEAQAIGFIENCRIAIFLLPDIYQNDKCNECIVHLFPSQRYLLLQVLL